MFWDSSSSNSDEVDNSIMSYVDVRNGEEVEHNSQGVDSVPSHVTSVQSSDSEESNTSFSLRTLSREKKILLLSICTTQFLIMASEALLNPLFPPQATKWGISAAVTGWIFGVFSLTQFIISPVFGKFLQTIGPKFTFVAGTFLAAGTAILYGSLEFIPLADGNLVIIVLCFIIEIFSAIAIAAVETSAFFFVTKEFPDNITFVFGLTEVAVGLGLTVGPVIGGSLYELGGYFLPFATVGSLIMSTVPLSMWKLRASQEQEPPERPIRQTRELLRHPSAWVICLATLTCGAVWTVLDPCLEPHLRKFSLSPPVVGSVFLLLSASYSLSCAISGWLSEKMSDTRYQMIVGFALCAVAHSLLGPSPLLGFANGYNELWLNITSVVLLGVAMSMAVIPTYDFIMNLALEIGFENNNQTLSTMAGLWCSVYSFGDFIGPVWGGWMLDNIGFQWGLTYVAGLCIIVTALLVLLVICDSQCCKSREVTVVQDASETSSLLQETRSDSSSEPSGSHDSMCYDSLTSNEAVASINVMPRTLEKDNIFFENKYPNVEIVA